MKRSLLVGLAVVVLGLLVGAAIAGRPTTVDNTVITPTPTTVDATTILDTTTTPPETSPPTTVNAAPNSARVLVANGTDRAGIATATAGALIDAGFTDSRAVDAVAPLEITVVYFRGGFEAEALTVAEELGLDEASVSPMSNTKVTGDDASADIIVAIGNDFPASP